MHRRKLLVPDDSLERLESLRSPCRLHNCARGLDKVPLTKDHRYSDQLNFPFLKNIIHELYFSCMKTRIK